MTGATAMQKYTLGVMTTARSNLNEQQQSRH
jgi:hypothetical protein